MKLIEEDELHQKFCDKLNNLDRDGFGGSVASNVMKNFIFLYLQQKDVQRSLFS